MYNSKRCSNFELLRIFSILLVLSMHCYAMGKSNSMSLPNCYLGHLINAIGNTGVSCFVLISGYFGIRFKLERFLQLILLTTVYTVLVTAVNRGFVLNMDFLKSLLVIPLYNNWFISCYLLLMVLSTFLNPFAEHLNRKNYGRMLLIGLIFLSIIPTLFNSAYHTIVTGGGVNVLYI